MRTTRDRVTKDGWLLLSADHLLTERMIRQIGDFERSSGAAFLVYVKLQAEAA